ncbi:pseudouridine synthase [Nonomuraea thailandensis]
MDARAAPAVAGVPPSAPTTLVAAPEAASAATTNPVAAAPAARAASATTPAATPCAPTGAAAAPGTAAGATARTRAVPAATTASAATTGPAAMTASPAAATALPVAGAMTASAGVVIGLPAMTASAGVVIGLPAMTASAAGVTGRSVASAMTASAGVASVPPARSATGVVSVTTAHPAATSGAAVTVPRAVTSAVRTAVTCGPAGSGPGGAGVARTPRPGRRRARPAPATAGATATIGRAEPARRAPRRDDVQTIGGGARRGGGSPGYGSPQHDRIKAARQPIRDRDLFPEGYTDERDTTEVPGGVRLQKVLAQAGVASRRACEEMIGEGRVTVNGQVVRRFGAKVDPATQVIHVDGKRIPTAPDLVYYALNKPIGVVSTMDDPQGRPCLADYVEELAPRLFHVGRLDTETEGLLLLTNDGELANRLTHPSYGVQKKYWAKVPGPIPRDLGRRLKQGIELEDGIARADAFSIVQEHGQQALVEVVLHEGASTWCGGCWRRPVTA